MAANDYTFRVEGHFDTDLIHIYLMDRLVRTVQVPNKDEQQRIENLLRPSLPNREESGL